MINFLALFQDGSQHFPLVSQDLSFLLDIEKKIVTKGRKIVKEARKFENFFYTSAHFPSQNPQSQKI